MVEMLFKFDLQLIGAFDRLAHLAHQATIYGQAQLDVGIDQTLKLVTVLHQ